MRILYGGSVKPENARALLSQPEIDGALIGGASLDPHSLTAIVKEGLTEFGGGPSAGFSLLRWRSRRSRVFQEKAADD